FSYKTKSGKEVRVPSDSTKTYSFVLSDKIVFPPSERLNSSLTFELFQNYPNPFNGTTKIRFSIPEQESVELNIYNILGQRVKSLTPNTQFSKGAHEVVWDGRDEDNNQVSSGVYIYRVESLKYLSSKKLVLLR
ncbi:MAG: T9SS type A sorting domain-containing protein, partial [Ignavibacteria bacterium]|nr:T9SS type A sorting domain-containing protein [Ignavibacteria bacterium]